MQDIVKTQKLEEDHQQCAWCGAKGIDAATFWLLDAGLRQLGVFIGKRDTITGRWLYDVKSLEGMYFRRLYVDINIRGIQASVLLPIARLNDDGSIIAKLPEDFYNSLLPMFELHCVRELNAEQMTIDDIRRVINEDEGQRTEFKESFAKEDEAIRSLCAFAHADGGTVFFGVCDDKRIIGVTLGKNTLESFANKIRSQTCPPLSPLIDKMEFDGKTIVLVTVSKAPEGQLVYAFNRPFIRVGKTNQVMSPEEQRARLQRGMFTGLEKFE